MEDVQIKYSSFALATDDIAITKAYIFGKDSKGYFYKDNKQKVHAELDYIKMIFSPVGKTWDETLKIKNIISKET